MQNLKLEEKSPPEEYVEI